MAKHQPVTVRRHAYQAWPAQSKIADQDESSAPAHAPVAGGPINAAQRTVINDVETEDIDERQDTDSQLRWQGELQEERLPI